MDESKLNFLVLLDHSKAFATIDHGMLSMKLVHFFNFSEPSTRLLSSNLSNRSQFVHSINAQSSALNLCIGQGSILGPLLFTIFINDLPSQLQYCRIHMYADDLQLHLSSPVPSITLNVNRLNDDLNRIYHWAKANGFRLNPNKSKCVVIRRRALNFNIGFDILMNGEKIRIVDAARNFGLTFNANLTWTNHVNTLVGQTYMKLRCLWSTQYFTRLSIRRLITKSYFLPGLMTGCERKKLNVVFNNIVR